MEGLYRYFGLHNISYQTQNDIKKLSPIYIITMENPLKNMEQIRFPLRFSHDEFSNTQCC